MIALPSWLTVSQLSVACSFEVVLYLPIFIFSIVWYVKKYIWHQTFFAKLYRYIKYRPIFIFNGTHNSKFTIMQSLKIHYTINVSYSWDKYDTLDVLSVRLQPDSAGNDVLLELRNGTSWTAVCLPVSHWLLAELHDEICTRLSWVTADVFRIARRFSRRQPCWCCRLYTIARESDLQKTPKGRKWAWGVVFLCENNLVILESVVGRKWFWCIFSA